MDAKNAKGLTALQIAWDKSDTEMVKTLIDAGADVNVRWKDGFTLLMKAANLTGDAGLEIVKALLAAGALLECKCSEPSKVPGIKVNGNRALILAAWRGNIAVVKELVAAGANVDARSEGGDTALTVAAAAEQGHVSVVKALLAAGAGLEFSSISTDSWKGMTALLWAVCKGHHNVVQLLLAAGADASAQTSKGDNALTLAAQRSDAKMVKMIADNLAAGKKRKRWAEGAAGAKGKKKKKIKKENKESENGAIKSEPLDLDDLVDYTGKGKGKGGKDKGKGKGSA